MMWIWSILAWVVVGALFLLSLTAYGWISEVLFIMAMVGLVITIAYVYQFGKQHGRDGEYDEYDGTLLSIPIAVSFLWTAMVIQERESYLSFSRQLERAREEKGLFLSTVAYIMAIPVFCLFMVLLVFMMCVFPLSWVYETIRDKRKQKDEK